MSSSGRSSAEWRLALVSRPRACRGAIVVALVGLLAGPPPGFAAADESAAAVADLAIGSDAPVSAPGAMAECLAASADEGAPSLCLEALERQLASELADIVADAAAHFATLDAITGNQRASRTLAQSEAAYELYRDLDCHLVELAQGVSPAAAEHRVACRVDHDRARIGKLAALLPEPPLAAAERAMILGTAWRAIEIDAAPVAADVEITLEIDTAAAVSGRGGCNRYFGSAEITGQRLDFGALGSTRMACPEPAMTEEARYFQALEAVTTWSIEDDGLSLVDDTGAVRVRLERTAS